MKKKLHCVLLIDDDEPTNFLYRIIVEASNCTNNIRIAQSGEDALDYLSKAGHTGNPMYPQPDLIFLDINMPCLDGWEFMEKYATLQLHREHQPVIIMLSTSLNPDDEVKAKKNPYITAFRHKPLTREMILEIIDRYF